MPRNIGQGIAFSHITEKVAVEATVEFRIRERIREGQGKRDCVGGAWLDRCRQLQALDGNCAAIELIANVADAAADRLGAITEQVGIVVVESNRRDLDLVSPEADAGFVVPAFFGAGVRTAGAGRREAA